MAEWEMSKERAEALAALVKREAPHLEVKVRSCFEVFEHMRGKDDGTYCVEIAKPGEPQPTNYAARMARVLEWEKDWEDTKEVWGFMKKFF